MNSEEIKNIRAKIEAEQIKNKKQEDKETELRIKEKLLQRKELELNARQEVFDQEDTNTVSVQTAFNRTWTAILKAGTIKDLTHLTTQDEIYNAVVNKGAGYKVLVGGIAYVSLSSVTKSDVLCEFVVSRVTASQVQHLIILCNKGNITAPSIFGVTDYETKKYIDTSNTALLNSNITLTFDDGTSKIIKVGE